MNDFFAHPANYVSIFEPYTQVADVYIPCHFWHPESPVFFTKEQMRNSKFNISVIADISCDIGAPIPSTIRASTITEPFYDIQKQTCHEAPAFSGDGFITVMAVDNLPGELPRDASEDFARSLTDHVFDCLLNTDNEEVVKRATILEEGKIAQKYIFLEPYARGEE